MPSSGPRHKTDPAPRPDPESTAPEGEVSRGGSAAAGAAAQGAGEGGGIDAEARLRDEFARRPGGEEGGGAAEWRRCPNPSPYPNP